MKKQTTTLKADLYNVFINGNANTNEILRVFGFITISIGILSLLGNHLL